MLEDLVSVKTCKKYQTVLEKIVKQFFARPSLFQQDEKNKNVIKLITNRWAWALVPTKMVEPGNALAWGGRIHGNPVSSPHQAPSHWTIQWNTYRPNTYLAHTSRGREGWEKPKHKLARKQQAIATTLCEELQASNCIFKSWGAPARGIRPPLL